MRPGSTTEKCPAQSSRLPMMLEMVGPTLAGGSNGIAGKILVCEKAHGLSRHQQALADKPFQLAMIRWRIGGRRQCRRR